MVPQNAKKTFVLYQIDNLFNILVAILDFLCSSQYNYRSFNFAIEKVVALKLLVITISTIAIAIVPAIFALKGNSKRKKRIATTVSSEKE